MRMTLEIPDGLLADARTAALDGCQFCAFAIETGMRWGELIALKPLHIDFLRKTITVQDTIIEVSKKHSPTGARYVAKPYPKDNEPRTFAVRQGWLDALDEHIRLHGLDRDDLLFTTRAGTPISRKRRPTMMSSGWTTSCVSPELVTTRNGTNGCWRTRAWIDSAVNMLRAPEPLVLR